MNPITNTKNQNVMNERELRLGYTGKVSSWHQQYKDSAWIFVGGLQYDLTEGDIVCVFSQYGEIANINLVRDHDTGKSKGFAFVCYENQKSTILATDNLNGIKIGGRTIRVDHVEKYKVPNVGMMTVGIENPDQLPTNVENVTDFVRLHGCAPEVMKRVAKIQKEQEETEKLKAIRQRQIYGTTNIDHPAHLSRSRSPHATSEASNNYTRKFSPPTSRPTRQSSASPPRPVRRLGRSLRRSPLSSKNYD